MEEEKILSEAEEVLAAKKDAWKYGVGLEANFALCTELTVEITLAEYRELIKASVELSNERSRRYTAESKIKDLEKKIAELDKDLEEKNAYIMAKEDTGC